MAIGRRIPFAVFSALLASGMVPLVPTSLAEDVPVVTFNVERFEVVGKNPLDKLTIDTTLAPFLGAHEGLEALLEAAVELESRILAEGHSFHRVILPPQTIEDGTIRLQVVVFTLGNVTVSGNDHFSEENIKTSLPGLDPGTVPDTRQLSRELIIANDHPSKDVTIRMKHSKLPDSVDAELVVQDRRPWQFFSVLNNIGVDETGEYRLSAGYQHANLLDLDDSFTVSYTTSPGHWDDVKQYGINYRLPLYDLSGSLSFFYSRSDVDSGRIEQVFDVSGAGKFLGGSYTHTFLNFENYRHRLTVGVEDKLFENNIDFQGFPIGVDVRSRPLAVSYTGEWRFERSQLHYQASYVRNLAGGALNESPVYAAARLGAKRTWETLRFSGYANYSLENNWFINFVMTAQFTGEPLISGEQFGLGGVNSVRGFDERAVSGDQGMRVTAEVWTPPLKYNTRLLAFVDAGYVHSEDVAPGQFSNDTLVSLGLGLRWRWSDRLSVNLDYGHEVERARLSNTGGTKLHMNIFYRL